MHSWIFRHILQLEGIYARRNRRRRSVDGSDLAQGELRIHVLIPLPRHAEPDRAA